MRISEIEAPQPKTPEQQRMASLQTTAKNAQQAVKAERAKQTATKAQQDLAAANMPVSQQLSVKTTAT